MMTSETINILLADDHAIVRAGLRELLNSHDNFCVIGEADSGEKVIGLLSECTPDVIIMDLNMPGIGGIEAIRNIKKIRTDIPVIALTVNVSEPFPTQVMKAGGHGYLSKQCAPAELVNAIETVISGHVYAFDQKTMPSKDCANITDFNLTRRETQVLQLVGQGMELACVASSLSLSYKTVHHHRKSLMKKISANNNLGIVEFARHIGLNNT